MFAVSHVIARTIAKVRELLHAAERVELPPIETKRKGRPPRVGGKELTKALRLYEAGALSAKAAGKHCGRARVRDGVEGGAVQLAASRHAP